MRPAPRRPSGYGAGPGPSMAPDLTNWLPAAGSVVLGFGALLWCGAALACAVTGSGMPDGGLLAALGALGSMSEPATAWPVPTTPC